MKPRAPFHRSHRLAAVGLLVLGMSGLAQAQARTQTYGPEDEGRRFEDGSRVVCEDVVVRKATTDPNRIAGTAAGAVIGGLVGSQVGSGRGRDAATVGGAIVGGAIGRKVQGNTQENHGDRVVEQRCRRIRP